LFLLLGNKMNNKFIQLQRLDSDGKNLGGLYLNTNHIVSVYYELVRSTKQTKISTVNGEVYSVPHTISEVLDMLYE